MEFHGEHKEFLDSLNNLFGTSQKQLKKQGNALRFTVKIQGKNVNLDLFKTGTVRIQPNPSNELITKIEMLLIQLI